MTLLHHVQGLAAGTTTFKPRWRLAATASLIREVIARE